MSKKHRNDFTEKDKTGEVISWVVIFILLFAFFPLGLLFLFLKLRGSISSSGTRNTTSNKEDNRYRNAVSVKYTDVTPQAPKPQTTTETQAKPETQTQNPQTQETPRVEASYAKNGKIRNPLKKKTGKFISAVMLVISISLIIVGFVGIANVLQQLFGHMTTNWFLIAMSAFFFLGGFATFLSRNVVARRYSRFKNYFAFIGERGVVPLFELAQVAGVSVKAANRDLHMMINNGYLADGVYIDNELECLVLSPLEAQRLRMEIKGMAADSSPVSPIADDTMQDSYSNVLAEFYEVNSFIVDEEISEKVSHLAGVTAKIFKIVDETPEKKSQLKRFMSYYLPTTMKLVRSYVTLEKQGIRGENIAGAKKNIGNILDTLSTGFEQQLDMLFRADALDIAADISVPENLMQQDGLMNNGAAFQVTGAAQFK